MSIDKLKTKFFTGAWLTDVKHYFTKINEIIDYLNGNGSSGDGSYRVYTALLTQSGTNAPTAVILRNTLNINPVWSRQNPGDYYFTFSNGFPLNKTAVFGSKKYINMERSSASAIVVNSFDTDDVTPLDDVLGNNVIEIRVYN